MVGPASQILVKTRVNIYEEPNAYRLVDAFAHNESCFFFHRQAEPMISDNEECCGFQPNSSIMRRGLAQSTARELGPKGIHVAHFVIDGGVRSARRPDPANRPDSTLGPDGIAQTYIEILRQPRSAWSLEVELRPWVETF